MDLVRRSSLIAAPRDFTVDDWTVVLSAGAVLIVLLIAGWVLVAWLRRRMLRGDGPPSAWNLERIDDLKRRGLIDEAEYRRLRSAALEALGLAVRPTPKANQPTPATPDGSTAATPDGPTAARPDDQAEPGKSSQPGEPGESAR